MGTNSKIALLFAASMAAMSVAAPAFASEAAEAAQGGSGPQSDSDIIVTARKRQESILKVPVVVSVVSAEKIENLAITQITDLPKVAPGLLFGGNLLAIGPQVSLRGVGTSSYDPGVDQSVSLNVDGLSLGQGMAFSSGMFDVQQVEVLKGPQALFFGKSSPGGVISLRTADPTDKFELIGRAAYEIEGREGRGELIVSGPVSDTLKARLATTYSAGAGYFINQGQALSPFGGVSPAHVRQPQPRNFIIRGTLLWKPSDQFSARLKVNYSYDHSVNPDNRQLANCPEGIQIFSFGPTPIPFIGGEDCKLDRYTHQVDLSPTAFRDLPNNGEPFLQNKQTFGTLELNYELTPHLSLTSTTAYYKLNSTSLVNAANQTDAGPTLGVTNVFGRREFTEELRLASDFSGPFNFTLGGYYEDGEIFDRVALIGNKTISPFAAFFADSSTTVAIKTYSLFGQVRYKLTEQLELAAGVRWTDETRRERTFNYVTSTDYTATLPVPRVHAANFAPEFTLSYTPTDDITIFGSYKKAYKSGSFKLAVPAAPGENNAFGDERVEGGEIGLKSRWLDRSLILNLALYDYRYKGLQVGGIEESQNGIPLIRTVNAGAARSYGVDFDLAYRPPSIDKLNLNLAVNWNHARYKDLINIPCYVGQTIAQGCNQFLNTSTGRFTAQDLSGTPMLRAPEWAVNFGFDYELPLSSKVNLVIANNNQVSSKYTTFPGVNRPLDDNFQRGYIKTDLSLTFKDTNDHWELALIGKNITDKVTSSNCSASNFAGGNFLGGQITGGTTSGPAGYGEVVCYSDRGRSAWIRLTLKN